MKLQQGKLSRHGGAVAYQRLVRVAFLHGIGQLLGFGYRRKSQKIAPAGKDHTLRGLHKRCHLSAYFVLLAPQRRYIFEVDPVEKGTGPAHFGQPRRLENVALDLGRPTVNQAYFVLCASQRMSAEAIFARRHPPFSPLIGHFLITQ